MHWLLHNKFDHDPKVRELEANLNRLGIPYFKAGTVPFTEHTDEIIFDDSSVTVDDLKPLNIYTYGSYTMAIKASRLFNPGAYTSPNIAIDKLLENYSTEMLNSDMIISSLEDLNPELDSFFIRPVLDTKSIVGQVLSKDEFIKWKNRVLTENVFDSGYSTVNGKTMFCTSSIKSIDAEYRCFIVNGKVATASQYKRNRVPYMTSNVDSYVTDYANNMASHWQPDQAFVLDIALSDNKLSVIEANCINSSGLYDIDTQKLIMRIEEL